MSLPTGPDLTPTYLLNPLKDDFVCQYNGEDLVLLSGEIKEFPKYLADHIAKHLAQNMALADSSKIHYEDRFAKYLKEIYIDING